THVFNYHIPFEAEAYVHRIGRTGRAKKDGIAMMLLTPHELRELKRIQEEMGSELELQSIPQKNASQADKERALADMVRSQRATKAGEALLTALTDKTDLATVANKLALLLEKTLVEDAAIGRSIEEVGQLLQAVGDDVESESKKSSRRRSSSKKSSSRSRSSSGGRGRRRHSDEKIRRGTGRGEVPEPTINSVGGSRIVARKLY
ncbi:MAG TPA: helicase-related protein, partial [Spirochaetota bacterium]|nr:helicase-related protein [Spirochaetota bacterium]